MFLSYIITPPERAQPNILIQNVKSSIKRQRVSFNEQRNPRTDPKF
jgi:hypothetical protein